MSVAGRVKDNTSSQRSRKHNTPFSPGIDGLGKRKRIVFGPKAVCHHLLALILMLHVLIHSRQLPSYVRGTHSEPVRKMKFAEYELFHRSGLSFSNKCVDLKWRCSNVKEFLQLLIKWDNDNVFVPPFCEANDIKYLIQYMGGFNIPNACSDDFKRPWAQSFVFKHEVLHMFSDLLPELRDNPLLHCDLFVAGQQRQTPQHIDTRVEDSWFIVIVDIFQDSYWILYCGTNKHDLSEVPVLLTKGTIIIVQMFQRHRVFSTKYSYHTRSHLVLTYGGKPPNMSGGTPQDSV